MVRKKGEKEGRGTLTQVLKLSGPEDSGEKKGRERREWHTNSRSEDFRSREQW